MAIPEFFRQIGEEYFVKASKAKDEKASNLYQEAAGLSLEGKLEEARKKGALAQELLEESSGLLEKSQKLLQEFVPGIIGQLKEKFGIEEPPVEFLKRITEKIEVPPLVEKAPKVARKEVKITEIGLTLTHKQYQVARTRFRLVDTERVEATLDQAIEEIYKEELTKGENIQTIKTRIAGNWNTAVKKIKAGFNLLLTAEEPVRLPFTEEQIAQLDFSEETKDLYHRLSQVESYRGLTLDELIEFTKGWGPIRLKLKPEVKEEARLYAFTPPEIFYLANRILIKDGESLVEEDRGALKTIVKSLEEKVKIEDSENLERGLFEKLQLFKADQGTFFDAQNESGQLLLAMVAGKSPKELRDLLFILI